MLKSNMFFSVLKLLSIITILSAVTSCNNDNEDILPNGPQSSGCQELILYAGWSYGEQTNTYKDSYSPPEEIPDRHGAFFPVNSSAWHINYNSTNDRNFDDNAVRGGDDKSLIQHFSWRLQGFGPITDAKLEFGALPVDTGPDLDRDNIQIYPYYLAQGSIGVHAMVGAYLGSDSGQKIVGLKPNKWGDYYDASFTNSQYFSIDLKNFPSNAYDKTHGGYNPGVLGYPFGGIGYFQPNVEEDGEYQVPGGYDLLRIMNHFKFIDILIGGDTTVDYMKLTLKSCTCN